MSACAGTAEWEWYLLGSQLCKPWVTVVSPFCSLRPRVRCQFWLLRSPKLPHLINITLLYILSFKYRNQLFHVHVSDSKGLGHLKRGNARHSPSPRTRGWAHIIDKSTPLAFYSKACRPVHLWLLFAIYVRYFFSFKLFGLYYFFIHIIFFLS